MNNQQAPLRIFKPRASRGWISLVFMASIILALGIAPAIAAGLDSASSLLTLLICLPVAISFLVLALWFPSMRYELGAGELVLRYGPVLTYRIRPREISAIRRTDLSPTIWSCIRFPGIALFTAPYGGVGNLKMCASAALNRILLIETTQGKYGITPADEEGFVRALREQMEA